MSSNSKSNFAEEPLVGYSGKLTYADYLQFDFDYMVEIIKGQLFKMTPAPTSWHQRISVRLTAILSNHLSEKSCELFHAPYDVVLPVANESKKSSTTVVQPDLCVICDPNKIDDAGCFGAPDLIIEILSPSTKKKDLTHKYEIFELTGVREYWIIFPLDKMLQVHILENGSYKRPEIYDHQDVVGSQIFPNLEIDLAQVFREFD